MELSDINRLREAAWRRELSPEERTQCGGAQEDWALEQALTRALKKIPDVPVASNFTARVVETAERDIRPESLALGNWLLSWRRWLLRGAMAVLVLGLGLFGYRQHVHSQRTELAVSVQEFGSLAATPVAGPMNYADTWRDFDAIWQVGAAGPDIELLNLLQ